MISLPKATFYEFFAGGGMVRAGLGEDWNCLFANDFDATKARIYKYNWGEENFIFGDVTDVGLTSLPGIADLCWASFPCQDLSLAGDYRGLGRADSEVATRSGAFWPFWSIMRGLIKESRGPRTIVLENVCGILTSHKGTDFAAICSAIVDVGYRFGAIVIDAKNFVPQSRPRLFIVAVHPDSSIPANLTLAGPDSLWQPANVVKAASILPDKVRSRWIWWSADHPQKRKTIFADLLEIKEHGSQWHSPMQTNRLLAMMSVVNQRKIIVARALGRQTVGCIYKRTRLDANGLRQQRAEVRFDDIAGCLRTPGGGSSRQTLIFIDGENTRSRLLSPRESARLMGLSDEYKLPQNQNEAYHLTGDGVCVPAVRHLADQILKPLLEFNVNIMMAAE